MRLIALPEEVPRADPSETDETLFLFWPFSSFRGAPVGPNDRARRADHLSHYCSRVLDFGQTRLLWTPAGGAEFDAACTPAYPALWFSRSTLVVLKTRRVTIRILIFQRVIVLLLWLLDCGRATLVVSETQSLYSSCRPL